MKIAVLSAANSIHTIKIVNGLAGLGHEVVLFSLPNHTDKDNAVSAGVKVIYLKYKGALGYFLNRGLLKKLLCKENFDVLNAHYASGYGTLARLTGFRPCVLSVWGSDVYDFPYLGKFNCQLLKKNLAYPDALLSTSHVMAKQALKFTQNHIDVTPFGVDLSEFFPKEKADSEKVTIGFIKGVSAKYGIEYLIRAFAVVLKEAQVPVCLEVYGDGNQMEEMKRLTQDLKIDGAVTFHGRIPHSRVPDALSGIDIFCVPSTLDSESFGVAAVEAMACGVPCVTSDADGLTEVMVNGETGFIVKRCDSEALAGKLLVLVHDSSLRKTMGEAGIKRVSENYDWQENLKLIEKYLIRAFEKNSKVN